MLQLLLASLLVAHLQETCAIFLKPDFQSAWIDIESSDDISLTTKTVDHGLGEVPLLVDVQVRALDGPNQGYIFQASGIQIRDDDQSEGHSAVIYIYNDQHVKVTAPLQNNNYRGRCLYTAETPYWDGLNDQDSWYAQFRVRAWKASSIPTPDFSVTGEYIAAGTDSVSDSYHEHSHGISGYPELVISRVKIPSTQSSYANYYFDSVGATHAMYRDFRYQINGYVVYGYDATKIRVWAGTDSQNRLFAGGDGFGISLSVSTGDLELYAWSADSLLANVTKKKTIGQSVSESDLYTTWSSIGSVDDVFTRAWVMATDGSNENFLFVGAGTALTYETGTTSTPCSYGGMVYSYSTTQARFWQPGDYSTGALICLSDQLAGGTNAQASKNGQAWVKSWYLDTDECKTNPCQNGGTCTNYNMGYTCACVSGWEGTNCENNIDDCASNPCQNGAVCNDFTNRYTCTCAGGWTGTHCQTDVNECSSNPCQNGGTCNNLQNRYTCTCVAGYSGPNCQAGVGFLKPDFQSDWIDIESSDDISLTTKTVDHGLGEVPLLVDVQVRALDGPNQGYIFQASGIQIRDDDQSEGHSAVIYIYNDQHVKVTAPLQNNNYRGRCLYTAETPYWDGLNDQDSWYAQFRVRAWKASSFPTPDFSVTGEYIAAGTDSVSDSYHEHSHGISGYPELVISRVKIPSTQSSYADYYFDSVGATHAMYRDFRYQNNGYVVYGYDATKIRVWAGTDSKNRLFVGGDGFGISLSVSAGDLELYAWSADSLAANVTKKKTIGQSVSESDLYTTWSSIGSVDEVFTRAWVMATDGSNENFLFVGAGTTLTYETDTTSTPCSYGGMVYSYSTTQARFWQPGDYSTGALICLSDQLAGGTNAQASKNGQAWVKSWYLDTDECKTTPCQNGGTCFNYNTGYTCSCVAGWEGTNCENDIDECASNPCQNGAVCNDLSNRYTCNCTGGWTGTHCQTDVNECSSNPCQNNATCNNLQNRYTCTCVSGYSGTNCQTDIDECSSNPCQNGGTCSDNVNGYTCSCAGGWTGDNCQSDVNECSSNPCQNGGTCNNLQNQYTCTCVAGYTGTNCQTDINECASSPCQNGATCNDLINQYTCACASGWEGTNCDIDTDECASNPCQNGATCIDDVNGYTCSCTGGWNGTFCQTDIDECSSDPCQNGGVCNNLQNQYNCTCAAGYSGTNCQTDVDECVSNPCQNGATCNDQVNGYTCTCSGGWTGTICDQDFDECSSNPCLNGTCSNLQNSYKCTCYPGYTATNCDYLIGTPMDGNWGDWQAWQGCSVTCGTGIQRRYRNCDNPAPDYGGAPCTGDSYETNSCTAGSACAPVVDGNWGAWSSISGCSATCGQGIAVKVRQCDNPAPSNGGSVCSGETSIAETCMLQACSNANDSYGDSYVNVCPVDYFTCYSGAITCIQELFRCDCTPDCTDESDENWTWAGCDILCSGAPGLRGYLMELVGIVFFSFVTHRWLLR